MRHSGRGVGPQAALLAFHAQTTGYPDMESVIYRVLATRQTTKMCGRRRPCRNHWVSMALFLALVDPPLAKQLLESVDSSHDAIGTGGTGVGSGEWLRAWALVDPPHAVKLFERELAAAPNENAKRTVWYAGFEMVDFSEGRSEERVEARCPRNGNIFSPDQEF